MATHDGIDSANRTDDEVEGELAGFALASLEVALDATPGSDDDYLFSTSGLLVEKSDGMTPGQVDVTLHDGREYRITAKAMRLGLAAEVVVGLEHQVTIPANPATFARFRDRGNILRPEQVVECSCKWAAGTMGGLEDAAKLAAEHLDPEARARAERADKMWNEAIIRGEAAMKPLADAISAYAPLFPDVQHTGGGCMAIVVKVTGHEQVGVVTDLDGPWVVGFYRNERAWDEGEYGTADDDFVELAPEGTEPVAVAAALVAAFVKRGILTEPVAREEA